MRLAGLAATALFCLAISAASAVAASAAQADGPARGRPDLAGWWQAEPPFVALTYPASPPPLKPAAAAQYQRAAQRVAAGGTPEYCRPFKFTGFSYGIGSDMEILLNPGRATLIADEFGLVRRIYIGGTAPSKPLPTNNGISIGRWDGDTLVVETTGLDPTAPFPAPLAGAPSLGENAKVVERIHLQDKDTLVFEIETAAPDILTAPDRRRQIYHRVDKQIGYPLTICSSEDRTVDASGRQQFDMTTPKDLPPPPPG